MLVDKTPIRTTNGVLSAFSSTQNLSAAPNGNCDHHRFPGMASATEASAETLGTELTA
jgi:hypothetical protein